MEIPGAESVAVQSFEVVPGADSVQIIVQAHGRPQVLVCSFSKQQSFELTGKMFGASDKMDHGQVVAVLRQLAKRIPDFDPAPAPATAAPVQSSEAGQALATVSPSVPATAPALSSSSSESGGEIASAIEFALEIERCGREAGLSDHLVAEVFRFLVGPAVIQAAADRRTASGTESGGSGGGA